MGRDERRGARKDRNTRSTRVPVLGYYMIITDTEETEKNYFTGLRKSIPAAMQDRIVIKVVKANTSDMVDKCYEMYSREPQYRIPWIVFDRDEVNDFDKIISNASEKGINAGWSNPCIEIWFSAYFSEMPSSNDSVACCRNFSELFRRNTGTEYSKSDSEIYEKLCKYGNEDEAIRIAEKKYKELSDIYEKPSDMCPVTTIFMLVKEIKSKVSTDDK